MTLLSILALGFFLGMRHATDSDHVIAVTTIVSQQRKIGSAALIGIFWGIGHSITLLIVGGAIILFGVVIPERLGMSLEFCVALMLILLGLLNLGSFRRSLNEVQLSEHSHPHGFYLRLRPVFVGVVHGLAGSAAVALLVLPLIREPGHILLVDFWGGNDCRHDVDHCHRRRTDYLFGKSFQLVNRYIGAAAGALSLIFGLFLAHQIAFVDGLFR